MAYGDGASIDDSAPVWTHMGPGMMAILNSVMLGAAAMASLVVAAFFLRFWHQSRDSLFLWFSIAFAIDAGTRLLLGLSHISNEQEPFFYLARLATFCAIIVAIAQKNWPRGKGDAG
jgi:hypothetical protein